MRTLNEVSDPSKTAILVVDVQNDYCDPAGTAGKSGKDVSGAMKMIPTVQRFLTAAREHGAPVIFIQTINEPATYSAALADLHGLPSPVYCLRGTWGSEFTGMAPLPDEPVVIKHRYSAFVGTRLESILRTLKAENILVLGVSTNVCVESTTRHGFMLDYHTVIVSDCCSAYNRAAHDMTLRVHAKLFGHVATSQQIIDAWNANPARLPANV